MSETVSQRRLDFDRRNLPGDLAAALTMALVMVPDAIASALLVSVNPIFSLNSIMIGMPIAGLLTSSQFMNVNLTAAGYRQSCHRPVSGFSRGWIVGWHRRWVEGGREVALDERL